MVSRIETEQGEVAECRIKSSQLLPIQPKSLHVVALVMFWYDNFDQKI